MANPSHPITYRGHARALLVLGTPLIGSQLAQFSIQITDTIMLGRYSVDALAAVTLAGSLYFVIYIVGAGFAWATMPMIASAEEAGDLTQARRVARMGLWLSMIYAAVLMPPLWWSEAMFLSIGQDADVAAAAQDYLRIAGWALFPGLITMLLRSYLSALERTAVLLWVTLGVAFLNAALNWAFIFGNFGAPELGLRGAALASLLTTVAGAIALGIYAVRKFPEHALFRRLWKSDWEAFGAVWRLGYPIGLTMLAESGLFSMTAVMMGWLGKLELAAHGIALQLTSLMFMLHIGLSQAATVRAGRAAGRRDGVGLRRGGLVAIALSMTFVVATVILFVTLPEPLSRIFLDADDPQADVILAIAVRLLLVAALFQLVDAAQIMALGLLRGVQDTSRPMIYAIISYWVVGIPASYVFGFTLELRGVGIWMGLVAGLALAGVLLMARFWGRSAWIEGTGDRATG